MTDETETGERLDARLREARDRLDRLESRSHDVARPTAEPAQEPAEVTAGSAYVLFVPSSTGYVLVERDGAPPVPGETVTLSEREERFMVAKLGASPLPGDARACAFLEPA
jgi:hypothetical protein